MATRWAYRQFAFEPFAGLAYVRVATDAFREIGGPAALMAPDQSHEVGYSSVGLRTATSFMAGTATVVPYLTVAWQHALNGVTPTTAVAFAASGVGMNVSGVPIARDSALVDTGFDVVVTRNAAIGFSYIGQLANDAHDHAVKGRATVRF